MATNFSVCQLDDLSPGDAKGFDIKTPEGPVSLIVILEGKQVIGYLNRCPHTGVNLDWKPGTFLDDSGRYLQCATHGALFRITDGYCVHGPCARESLEPVNLRIRKGSVELSVVDEHDVSC